MLLLAPPANVSEPFARLCCILDVRTLRGSNIDSDYYLNTRKIWRRNVAITTEWQTDSYSATWNKGTVNLQCSRRQWLPLRRIVGTVKIIVPQWRKKQRKNCLPCNVAIVILIVENRSEECVNTKKRRVWLVDRQKLTLSVSSKRDDCF